MKRKVIVYGLVIIVLAGLSFYILRSNYESAMEETRDGNAAIEENDSASVIDLTGPPPDWTEEVLMGLFANRNVLAIRVRTGGCTQKEDFWIWCSYDEKSEGGIPHYVLTIYRMRKDECKGFFPSGILIEFNLREKLGLPPYLFTYSVTNRVEVGVSPSAVQKIQQEDSVAELSEKFKRFTMDGVVPDEFIFHVFPEIKEIRPEPYVKFVMDNDYFTCLIPARWELKRDKEGGEKAGIFEIRLTKTDTAKPEDGEKYFFPDPLIYVGYYAKDNNQNKTYEDFMKEYDGLMQKNEGSEKSRYEKPRNITFNGKEMVEHAYEVYQEMPRGPLFTIKYWLKARFVFLKAKEGFYVLAYKSPREFYDEHLPVFEAVVKSFKPLY